MKKKKRFMTCHSWWRIGEVKNGCFGFSLLSKGNWVLCGTWGDLKSRNEGIEVGLEKLARQ